MPPPDGDDRISGNGFTRRSLEILHLFANALERLVAAIEARGASLKGVLHSAMVIDDGENARSALSSFIKLRQVDVGFSARNVLTMRISLPDAKYLATTDTASGLTLPESR